MEKTFITKYCIAGWFQKHWWRVRNLEENIDCSIAQMDEIAEGTFAVDSVDLFYDNLMTDSSSVSVSFNHH